MFLSVSISKATKMIVAPPGQVKADEANSSFNFARLRECLHHFLYIVGKEGALLLIANSILGLAMAVIECGIVAMIQVFLVKKGFADESLDSRLHGLVKVPMVGIAGLLVAIGIIRAVCAFLADKTSADAAEGILSRLRAVTFTHVLKTGAPPSSSLILALYSDFFPRIKAVIFKASGMVMLVAQAVLLIAGMLYMSSELALIAFAVLLPSGLLLRGLHKRMRALAALSPPIQQGLARDMERVVRNQLFVRISGTENREYFGLLSRLVSAFEVVRKSRALISLGESSTLLLGVSIIALLMVISEQITGLSGVAFVSFVYMFMRFSQVLSGIISRFSDVTANLYSFKFVFDYIGSVPAALVQDAFKSVSEALKKRRSVSSALQQGGAKARLTVVAPPEVSVRDSWFSWDPERGSVISGLSVDVPARGRLVIFGRSGSGKSTFLRVLLGLENLDRGSVFLGRMAARDFLKECNHAVGYVGPDPFIIEGTLRENLQYGNNFTPSDGKIYEVLDVLGMGDVVRSLPSGLDTMMVYNREIFSTGQKQRISIARAFLKNPSLLIFDEATSNLDSRTEELVASVLREMRDCTMVIVSHRPIWRSFGSVILCMDCVSTICECYTA